MTSAVGTVLLSDAFHEAQSRAASDVHFVAGLPPVLRIDGRLEQWQGEGLSADDIHSLVDRFLNETEKAQLAVAGDITIATADAGTPIRIHVTKVAEGITIAVRFLARSLPTLEVLELPPVVCDLIRRPSGLIVIGGPTGSGKSTTLAALVMTLNRDAEKKIITIEDPIEYRVAPKRSIIVQRQVGRDVRTFADAIRGALRSDPDVIVVGEMRDEGTVAAALSAAETGHLVLGTLHTGDAAQSIDRLVDAFPAERSEHVRSRIARTVLCVLSQRLVPRSSGVGRCLVAEVLVVNDAVRHMIREGKHHQLPSVMATGRRFGMQTLESHLADLVAGGIVSTAAADAVLR